MAWGAKQRYAGRLAAWEVGNENSNAITSGGQLGRDLLRARDLAVAHGLKGGLVGPSLPKMAYAEEWLEDFMNATRGALDMFAVHVYGGVDCTDATGVSFVARATYAGWHKAVDEWVSYRDRFMAPTTGIFIEETASAPIGGCVNASDRYIDGFYCALSGGAQLSVWLFTPPPLCSLTPPILLNMQGSPFLASQVSMGRRKLTGRTWRAGVFWAANPTTSLRAPRVG